MRPPGVFTILRVLDLVRYGFRFVYVTRVFFTTAGTRGRAVRRGTRSQQGARQGGSEGGIHALLEEGRVLDGRLLVFL